MNRARLFLGLGASALAALLLPFAAASCADTENGSGGPSGGNPLPEAAPEAALPDGGGCDAADPSCVAEPISCADVFWCPVQTNVESLYSLVNVWGAASNDVWAVGAGATVIHWDGGKWSKTPVPPALPNPGEVRNTFTSVWGSGPNDVWIGSTTKTIYRNTGAGWEHQRIIFDGKDIDEVPVQAIWGDGPNRVRLGARAFMYEIPGFQLTGNQLTSSTSGKLDWQPEEGSAWVFGYFGTPDDLWLVGDNRYRNEWQRAYVDHGIRKAGKLEWTPSEVYSVVSLHAIWGSSANDIWIVGDQGAMRHLAPGKAEWEIVPPVTKESLYAIWGTSATNIWVAGENGTILHYDGTAWTPEPAAYPAGKKKPNLTGIWGSGQDDIWIVGGHVALHYNGKKGGIQ